MYNYVDKMGYSVKVFAKREHLTLPFKWFPTSFPETQDISQY